MYLSCRPICDDCGTVDGVPNIRYDCCVLEDSFCNRCQCCENSKSCTPSECSEDPDFSNCSCCRFCAFTVVSKVDDTAVKNIVMENQSCVTGQEIPLTDFDTCFMCREHIYYAIGVVDAEYGFVPYDMSSSSANLHIYSGHVHFGLPIDLPDPEEDIVMP
jgi:hypothetical protein